MNQIEVIIHLFQKNSLIKGVGCLWWYACNNALIQDKHPNTKIEYDSNSAFFKALEILLNCGDYCLFYTLNSEDPLRDGEHLSELPQEQLELLQRVWIDKEAMDKMDEENGYLGWYFLIYCPYSLAHKIYDENGNFIRWHHAV
ncbi:hypothetical protein [Acinetobacter sp. ANC 3882]|uniref:hypothetical protein n=1 Tax=Acinetobacter sp. ANC 3882 TaxID=2923423 RepID=UPI001F4AE6E3|nr:hypothetical protein [Acinetobacter sp. ANC 3882]MCH7312795.1 hypothetical protein [Acinetobacter sp. ANC 3882]